MGKFKLLNSVQRRMGCRGSKEEDDSGGGSNKGNASSAAAGPSGSGGAGAAGASVPTADPRIPMTAKQKYSLVASWKGIHRALEPTGILMFVKLFEGNAELLELFEKFTNLRTRKEQEESEELQEHATNVMESLDNAIRTLDNPDAFVQFVEEVGSRHRRIPGFNKDHFWKIEKPFLEAVKTTLDERYTDNIENIYKVAIHLVIETLIAGYEKGNQTQ